MRKREFRIGQKFILSEDAIENYGEKYRGAVFHIAQWFDHRCSVWELENDAHGHPDYDSASGDCLYEAKEDSCPGALYDREIKTI